MRRLHRILARWVPLAGVVAALALLNAVTAQQLLRGAADEPQVQLARDAAAALASGNDAQVALGSAAVDVAASLAPFVIVYRPNGDVVFSTAQLNGKTPELPGGVLAEVAARGEARFTWQPAPAVRIAAVVVPIGDGAQGDVLVGRSLVEVEDRIRQMTQLSMLGGGGAALTALLLITLVELLGAEPGP